MNNNFLIAMTLRTIRLMVQNEMYDDAKEHLDTLANLLENDSNITVSDCITDKVFKVSDDLCNQ